MVSSTYKTWMLFNIEFNDGTNSQSAQYNMTLIIVEVLLSDITITNRGTPYFLTELFNITMKVGENLTFSLPPSLDPDNDTFTIDVSLGKAFRFASYYD